MRISSSSRKLCASRRPFAPLGLSKDTWKIQKEDYPHLSQLAGDIRLYPDIEAKIENTLNENGAVKSSASPELKSIRKTIQTVKGRIQGRLQSTLRSKSVSPYLQDPIIRERKGRPVIAVKERDASRVPGAVRDRSDRGNTVFIEPEA